MTVALDQPFFSFPDADGTPLVCVFQEEDVAGTSPSKFEIISGGARAGSSGTYDRRAGHLILEEGPILPACSVTSTARSVYLLCDDLSIQMDEPEPDVEHSILYPGYFHTVPFAGRAADHRAQDDVDFSDFAERRAVARAYASF